MVDRHVKLLPFFCFYGGKYRIAPKYNIPAHNTIIEPFAGSAGYSVRHFSKDVILYDIDPVIVELWRYLTTAESKEIRELPTEIDNVDNCDIPVAAKYLIGFWLNKGTVAPSKSPSSWMRSGIRPNSYWGEAIRERIARQVDFIKHWRVERLSYIDVNVQTATWFVDPPYSCGGSLYKFKNIDYACLSLWVKSLPGQVICCERSGANWLDFKPLAYSKVNPSIKGSGIIKEMVYYSV